MSTNDPMNRDRFGTRDDDGSGTMGWGIAAVAAILVFGLIIWGMSGPTNFATTNPPAQTTGQGGKMTPPAGATNPLPKTTGQGNAAPPSSTNTPAGPKAPAEVPARPPVPPQPQ